VVVRRAREEVLVMGSASGVNGEIIVRREWGSGGRGSGADMPAVLATGHLEE
jgi:hypothetical protein